MAAAAVVPFVSVEEYLHTAYSPDVDYVDGQIEERNLGELDHGELQKRLLKLLGNLETEWNVRVTPELRVQVGAEKFRVPDVCVTTRERRDQVVRTPPLLCIEILSPDDRWPRVEVRLRDYFTMGVPEIWVFDPENRTVTVLRKDGTRSERNEGFLQLAGTRVELSLSDVFSVLDED